VAYYSFDPRHYGTTLWGFSKTAFFRAQFLIESVAELQRSLSELNISLIIDNRPPEEGIPDWVHRLNISKIFLQKEWTQEERLVENNLRASLDNEIEFYSHYDQFLFHPEDIPFEINNLPEVFTLFRKQCEKKSTVRKVLPEIALMPEENLLEYTFQAPSLAVLGLQQIEQHPNSAFPFKGGSEQAKRRLDHYFWDTNKLSYYKQTRNELLGINYSSKLSAWLANGSISPRQIYWEIMDYENEVKKNQSTYWLIFELIWRDYFKYIALKHQDAIFHLGGILNKDYHWYTSDAKVKSWIEGTTREPFVNANMIELNKTGWMSNRGRQNVASYFTKDLLLDWRIGAAYFESQLIDYDVHSNYGNWMYVAGVGNDPRDRKFNVRFQAERYDEGGKFQRLWNQKILF
jgi:deoxyribodipyrimidine photo-lyase